MRLFNSKDKKAISVILKIMIVLAVVVFIGLIVVVVWVWQSNESNIEATEDLIAKVEEKYMAAKVKCGSDPTVVVESEDWYGYHSTKIYAPNSEFYQDNKLAAHVGLGRVEATDYFCTLEEAITKYPDINVYK